MPEWRNIFESEDSAFGGWSQVQRKCDSRIGSIMSEAFGAGCSKPLDLLDCGLAPGTAKIRHGSLAEHCLLKRGP